MVFCENSIKKALKKGSLPKEIFQRFNSAFISLDTTNDLGLFDIKKLKSSEDRTYYRLRKREYRAIFYIEKDSYYVIMISKREEMYKRWE